MSPRKKPVDPEEVVLKFFGACVAGMLLVVLLLGAFQGWWS